MIWSIYIISILALAIGENTCTASQFYLRQVRQTGNYGGEESHQILSGATLVYTTPSLGNSELRTLETCIDINESKKYSFKLLDSYGDSWTSGSHLRVFNEFDGLLFAGYLTTPREEIFNNVILYTPVKASASWKFMNDVTATDWASTSFSDSTWTSVTLPNPSTTTSGTQYFRYSFVGHADAAAVEIGMKYQYGILAHLNGVEVYRDNMADGAVSKSTNANGEYSLSDYHNVIRSGNYVSSASTSVVAVEVHFTSTSPQTTINVNIWLAIYGSNIRDNTKCYEIYHAAQNVFGGTTSPVPTLAYNLGKTDYYSITGSGVSTSNPGWVSIAFYQRFQFNGFSIWPASMATYAPHTFTVAATMSDQASGTFTQLGAIGQFSMSPNAYRYGLLLFNTQNYKQIKITVTQSWGVYLYLYEFHPMVCGLPVPTTLTFTPTTTRYHKGLELIRIEPVAYGVSGCSVEPALPAGLSLDANSCAIVGVASVEKTMTTYTITATTPSLTGTFQLEIALCEGSYSAFEIFRFYGSNSSPETFKLLNEAGTTTLLEENTSTNQVDNTQAARSYCMLGTRFQVSVGSSNAYWYSSSYLQVRMILVTDREIVCQHRYDTIANLNPVMKISLYRVINPVSTWKFKFAYTDNTWYSADTSAWSGSIMGNFGTATNRYQVFRNTFNVPSDELAKSANFVLSVRYQYGIIVYMNDVEVYRNNVGDGALSSVQCIGFYTTVTYKQLSLPTKTQKIGETNPVQYIKSGSNSIAVALIAQLDSQTTVAFDAAIRLGTAEEERSWDATFAAVGTYNQAYFFHKSYAYNMYQSTCVTNSITVTLNDDRREWINSAYMMGYYSTSTASPRGFLLYAKNAADSDWVLMTNQTNWRWWSNSQHKKFYITNNKAYNMWKVQDVQAQGGTCTWRMHGIIFMATKTDIPLETLSYPSPYSGYRDVEMAELFPSSGVDYRGNFRVSPALPVGLVIDPPSGVLMGEPTALATRQSYTISADSVSGEVATTTLELEVVNCDNQKSLITTVIRSDNNYASCSYKMTTGRTTSGTVVTERNSLPLSSANIWIDRCLPHGMYTFFIKTTIANGLSFPGGIWMNIDHEKLIFNMQTINKVAPTERTMIFSSMLPFESEFTDWRVYRGTADVPANWNQITFDDSSWEVKKDYEVTTSATITMYYRVSVTIPESDVQYYQTVSGHCLHTGGFIGYFNGNRAVRFGLPENVKAIDSAVELHAGDKLSKFSFPLQLKGVTSGKNVFGFEHHRFKDHSTSSEHIFECNAVFGVEEVNVMNHGFEGFDGTPIPATYPWSYLIDGKLDTYVMIPNSDQLNIKWNTVNLERTQFNAYMMLNNFPYTGYTWSLDAKFTNENVQEPYETINVQSDVTFVERGREVFMCPVCMAGYHYYQFTLDAVGTGLMYQQQWAYAYVSVSGGSSCAQSGDYPPVGNGQVSPSVCPAAYKGYSYRVCNAGTFGEVMMDKCIMRPPQNMNYAKSSYELVVDTDVMIPPPLYENIITEFKIEGTSLPPGLTLDETTGAISGRPLVESSGVIIVVYGSNSQGSVNAEVEISCRLGRCIRTDQFPQTNVDETAVYDCSKKGAYFGELKAKCSLHETDGKWGKEEGMCTPIIMVVLIVLVVVLIIAVVVFIVIRSSKTKKKGGVKGAKKSAASGKGKTGKSMKV